MYKPDHIWVELQSPMDLVHDLTGDNTQVEVSIHGPSSAHATFAGYLEKKLPLPDRRPLHYLCKHYPSCFTGAPALHSERHTLHGWVRDGVDLNFEGWFEGLTLAQRDQVNGLMQELAQTVKYRRMDAQIPRFRLHHCIGCR